MNNQRQQQNNTFFKGILNNISSGIIILDHENLIQYLNKPAEEFIGYSAVELINKSITMIVRQQILQNNNEIILIHKNGERLFSKITLSTWTAENKTEYTAISFHSLPDHLSLDPLTGLINRHSFELLTKDFLYNQNDITLLFIDIDNFKEINDTYGHRIGDELLTAFSKRLKSCLRNTDIAARYGGDEFIILLNSLLAINQIELIIKRINNTYSKPFKLGRKIIDINLSIGVADSADNHNLTELIDRADQAMYISKKNNLLYFYHDEIFEK